MNFNLTNLDFSLTYIIFFVCALILISFIVFKLYKKVNDLNEKIEEIFYKKQEDDNREKINLLHGNENVNVNVNENVNENENENVNENENGHKFPVIEEVGDEINLPEDPGPSKLSTLKE